MAKESNLNAKLKGELVQINPVTSIPYEQGTKSFEQRTFVVKAADNPMYPEWIELKLAKNRFDVIDSYKVGDMVEVSYIPKGKAPQEGKRSFVSLEAWGIQPLDGTKTATRTPTPQPPAIDISQMGSDDDLPF